MEKYITTLVASCKIVAIGPLAFAGSILIFSNKDGIKSPVKTEERIAIKRAMDNTRLTSMLPYKNMFRIYKVMLERIPIKKTTQKCLKKYL